MPNICYTNAIPGILPNADKDTLGQTNTAQSVTSVNQSNVNSNSLYGVGINSGIANSMVYSDANGDINVLIDGPYSADLDPDPVTVGRYQVFVSRENAREKYTVYKNVGSAQSYKEDETIENAVIYSELDEADVTKVYVYLKIRHTDLLLARGTYVVRIYKETGATTEEYNALRIFTLTVQSDPIQPDAVNTEYINTANRLGNVSCKLQIVR